jgi:flagellar biosynthetic protein FliR
VIELPLMTIISGFLTISVRLSGLMLFAPMLGSAVIPARIKAVLVLALTVLLYPAFGERMGPRPVAQWPAIVITEFLIGVGMGIVTNIVFEGAQLTGQVLGIQMGYSLVNILDPQSQVETTVVSLFYQSLVMLLFLEMGVHYWLLRAVGNSFVYLPSGATHLSSLFSSAVVKLCGQIFGVGIQIAAPVLTATLVADILLGLLGKASPQLPLMLLGPSVKSLLGLLVLIATLRYWPVIFHRLFADGITNAEQLLRCAR